MYTAGNTVALTRPGYCCADYPVPATCQLGGGLFRGFRKQLCPVSHGGQQGLDLAGVQAIRLQGQNLLRVTGFYLPVPDCLVSIQYRGHLGHTTAAIYIRLEPKRFHNTVYIGKGNPGGRRLISFNGIPVIS